MATEVRLPRLGETMAEATIVGCMVKVGDEVKKGDVIFEIETDKATLEMESPAEGFVKHILAEVGQTLPVGKAVLVLADKDEQVPQSFIDSLKTDIPAAPAMQATSSAGTAKAEAAKPRPAKKSGKVRTWLGVRPGQPERAVPTEIRLGAVIPVKKWQKITAERMLKSKREMPCFYLTVAVDVTGLVELRTKLNKTGDAKISYNDFIIKAAATGLEKFPIMTGRLADDAIELADTINIGLAISVPDGLIVPVIKDVQKKSVSQIAAASKALIEKAGNNKLLLTDLEGGCFTVSNLGTLGVESFIPIVIPRQCSILGIGQIIDTCVPANEGIVIRKLMSMTLSVDHRVANGGYAAQFLDFVRKQLEDT